MCRIAQTFDWLVGILWLFGSSLSRREAEMLLILGMVIGANLAVLLLALCLAGSREAGESASGAGC
jgi:hypothetical protein